MRGGIVITHRSTALAFNAEIEIKMIASKNKASTTKIIPEKHASCGNTFREN